MAPDGVPGDPAVDAVGEGSSAAEQPHRPLGIPGQEPGRDDPPEEEEGTDHFPDQGQVRAEVTLHACDDKLDDNGPWHYALWEPVALPRGGVSGGGGTDFRPLFDWVEGLPASPDLLVYVTDAEGRFPEREPNYPVVWLVKGKSSVPFGTRIQLN